MLVVRDRGRRVLLEQRTADGLWGGLLVLPGYDGAIDDVEHWLAAHHGVRPNSVAPLPALRHAFTHFTLEIRPWLVEVADSARAITQPGTRWADTTSLDALPLPAPVRRILDGVPQLTPRPEACAAADRSG